MTQIIIASVLVVTAATIGSDHKVQSLNTLQQIAQAITPFVGEHTDTLMFALGTIGASLVATIVVTLTAARTQDEILGFRHSLECPLHEAPLVLWCLHGRPGAGRTAGRFWR